MREIPLERANGMRRRIMFKRVLALTAASVGLVGCAADWATDNAASVILEVTSVNGGKPLQASVKFPVAPDLVDVELANRAKNPNLSAPNAVPNGVKIERYEVRYFRSDGRNTEGVDVPYRISGNATTTVDVNGNATLTLEVVRAQAKLEPPLTNLRGATTGGANGASFGGSVILTCMAEVTVHGRTIAGQVVTSSGRMQIDFADWP
jgi:hypothetical protein